MVRDKPSYLKDDFNKTEKLVRYLIDIRLIRVYGKDDKNGKEDKEYSIKKYLEALNEYNWLEDRIPEEGRNEVLQEFVKVKQCLLTGNIRRSEHQFANTFAEVYHFYAHYYDTSMSR
uniref:Uncharacterized protein n=1 Tax=Panagrolaimus sp. ES5 TaxID=591445 RepID=A0AC34G0F6_9BILA